MNAFPVDGDSEKSPEKDFQSEVNRITLERLETEVLRSELVANLIAEEIEFSKTKRVIGGRIALLAGSVPLVILVFLAIMIGDGFFTGMGGDISKAIFISGSFLSFIVMYAMLIKGMFYQQPFPSDDKKHLSEEVGSVLHKNLMKGE